MRLDTPGPAGNLTGPITSVGLATSVANSIALPGNPTTTTQSPFDNSTKIATTAYVDAAGISMDSKPAVAYASTSALPSNTYANGTLGVGATLTGTANGPLVIDSVTILVGQVGERVLVAGEAAPANNGWYTITQQGVVAVSPYILTRATESDQAAEIGAGYLTSVTAPNSVTPGTANNGKVFISVAADPFTVGTTSLTFSAVGGTYSAGNGITLTGSTFSINTSITVDKSTAQALTNKDMSGAGNTWPTFNQNTTGSAAKWTTARNLAGNSVDGSADVAFANKFIVQGTADTGLSAAQFLGALGTGIVKNTITTGILSIAANSDLPAMSSSVGGAVPTPPNDNTKYLDGTGVFSVPAGGATGITTPIMDLVETVAVIPASHTVGGSLVVSGVTVTAANPAVFSLAAHGLLAGCKVVFTTTGTLPAPLVAGQIYFVINTGLTSGAFEVALTDGGTAINTTGGSQSGTHSVGQVVNANIPSPLDVAAGATLTIPSGNTLRVQELTTSPVSFSAYAAVNQSVSSGVYTKVTLGGTDFNTNADFSTANSRFTPSIAGLYLVVFSAQCAANAGTLTAAYTSLYKNGVAYAYGATYDGTAITNFIGGGFAFLIMNGTTDYVEMFCFVAGTSPLIYSALPGRTKMAGYLIKN